MLKGWFGIAVGMLVTLVTMLTCGEEVGTVVGMVSMTAVYLNDGKR